MSDRLLREPLLEDKHVRLSSVATHVEGSAITKGVFALSAIVVAMWRLTRSDVAHIQVATGRSVERKLVFAALCRILRVPVLTQFHGADTADDYGLGSRGHRRCYRALLKLSTRIGVLGTASAEWFRAHFDNLSLVVIPNFVPVPDSPAPLPREPAFIFLGRMEERKGVFTLLEAYERLLSLGTLDVPPTLTVVGDGRVSEVRSRVEASRAMRGKVRVHGWLPNEDVVALLRDSSCLVLPSRAEGLPMAILEAMSQGRMVIATSVGSISDVVVDGYNGILVEPDSVDELLGALTLASSTRAISARMGEAAFSTARDGFSSAAVVPLLTSIYFGMAAA
jgi:glycosyltransferase involved in cell wall biosynthesis